MYLLSLYYVVLCPQEDSQEMQDAMQQAMQEAGQAGQPQSGQAQGQKLQMSLEGMKGQAGDDSEAK